MKRRGLFKLGLGALVVVGLGGLGAALWTPGIDARRRLSPAGRDIFRAVATTVLDGCLPDRDPERHRSIDAHLVRLEAAIATLPPATRGELSLLLGMLSVAPGRVAIAGLREEWAAATSTDVATSLEHMRQSRTALRQQAYHALRDLTNAAYFADPAAWPLLGYPGPLSFDS